MSRCGWRASAKSSRRWMSRTPDTQGRVVVGMSPRREPGVHPGLFTDMYHPAAAYLSWVTGRNGATTFDLYARTAPFDGGYLLVAGLEAALEFVESFRYEPDELA